MGILGALGLAEDGAPSWMGFTEVRKDVRRRKTKGLHWLSDPSCMSDYRDKSERQWCLLSKVYDEVSWGGLVNPSQGDAASPIMPGRKQNICDVQMDPKYGIEIYTPELYENACHVLGSHARWRLNAGSGWFTVRFHILDWWKGGDRRFIVELCSAAMHESHTLCTPPTGHARVDEFRIHVPEPASTFDLCIIRDDSLGGDTFPCFSGFEVLRLEDPVDLEVQAPLSCPSRNKSKQGSVRKRSIPASTRAKSVACKPIPHRTQAHVRANSASTRKKSTRQPTQHCTEVHENKEAWHLELHDPPRGILDHPDDPNDRRLFQCVTRHCEDGNQEVVGLLAAPECAEGFRGLVLTCPGAGGGQGPADPLGGGGGGTYGAYNVYGRLAAQLPRLGIAVLLLHYPDGHPGHPLQGGIPRTVAHAEALIEWALGFAGDPRLPLAFIGWSMGGAVVIDAAANMLRRQEKADIRGVATIASMKEVCQDSPKILTDAKVDLLLMHNINRQCKALNSYKIGRLAGGIEPVIFDGENHGCASSFEHLLPWLHSQFHIGTS